MTRAVAPFNDPDVQGVWDEVKALGEVLNAAERRAEQAEARIRDALFAIEDHDLGRTGWRECKEEIVATLAPPEEKQP